MKVCARGIVLRSRGDKVPPGLRALATDELPIYAHCKLTLLDEVGASLNSRIVAVSQVAGPHRNADYFEEMDLRSGLLACAYHVEQMIQIYVERTEAFTGAHDPQATLRGNTSEPRAYYEVTAFLTEARTWYEALLRLLWKRVVKSDKAKPPHFTDFIARPLPPAIDATYAARVTDHWTRMGGALNAYRNVIIHSQPISEWGHTCWFEPLAGEFGMTVRLPANPKAARSDLDFDGGPDALDYCHAYLCELTDLAEATCELPQIRSRLDQPELSG